MAITYKDAGVDISAGEEVVYRIKKTVRSTFTKNVLSDIGLFGAFFDARFPSYKHPVLVSSVDGVGTKLKIASLVNKHDTIGQDLVNHCVNDILVCGAKPLYFLDYLATGKLDPAIVEQVIKGFSIACRENDCSIIGGETAEMPGFYTDSEYDIAGTIVGVVEKKKIIKGDKVKSGDLLIGLPSTGLHTNGYSLARKVLLDTYRVDSYIEELKMTIGEALLAVHRSYLHTIQVILKKYPVRGMSHITGGGIIGNTKRIIPKGLGLSIDWASWQRPHLFSFIQSVGQIPEEDMRRTFNLGIGLIIVASRDNADGIIRLLKRQNEQPVMIGEVIRAGSDVRR